jgi:hypothetical protein
MRHTVFVVCLLFLTLRTCAAFPPLTVTLPNADSYSYWVQSQSGPVGIMPVQVTHKKAVRIAAPVTTGDRLFVLDAHTGEVASHRISMGLSGAPLPISLVMGDFQPISAPVSAPPASAPIAPTPAPDKTPPANGIARLLTGLFSLILAAGVFWLVRHLIVTRGEPLRHLARRFGVEVADPADLTAEEAPAADAPVYTAERRAPETVPEEASLPPKSTDPPQSSPRLGRGPEVALLDIPALLGLQGLAAGSTFALTDGEVTVGRDGDNEIVLAESTVSRRHARLLRDSQGQFLLTDLGSANGVYINGTRIQQAILSTGDEIKIGDNYFRFQAAKENS